jgi:mutator protein MutT
MILMKRGIDYIGVGVGAAIFNKEGKLLVTLRGEKAKNERGKWEIPGGSVEFGETFEQAIKREIKEELGIEIEVLELLGICDHIIPDEHQHWVSPTYICKITKGVPKIHEPEKCAAVGWFTSEEAEKLPLSIVTNYDISLLKKKYQGLSKQFIKMHGSGKAKMPHPESTIDSG